MKSSKSLIIYITLLFFLTSCLSDLRTELNLNEGYSESNKQKGIVVLNNVYHQSNLILLKGYNQYNVDFSDEFIGVKGSVANPYKSKKTEFKLKYSPNTFNGEMTILNGKEKQRVFGLKEGRTYEIINNKTIYLKNKRSAFWLPTYQYFIEFPMRIITADKIFFAGVGEYNNKKYYKVLVSWKTFKPQKQIDQYLVWVSQETGVIDILQYTIRDYYGFIQGVTFMEEYKVFNGILLPSVLKVKSKMDNKNLMHIMRINKIDFN